ncbi:2-aminoethylphosphonate--pyruvate transaminase [Fusobacterium sp.]|uniref:2-aminoethylphosphonate--pyruvate transaminase n=1 Tax=Fusobacterium sp. TaxID=68766 RepID=UPI00260F4304|nr:2-aminoethylphosphonate--pyruvate transaminase [Fusobacterium sp.]
MEKEQRILLTSRIHNTSKKIKNSLCVDISPFEKSFKNMTQEIRDRVVKLATEANEEYTMIPIQGSGTFAVESVIGTVIGENEKVFVISNGLSGDRIGKICGRLKVNYTMYRGSNDSSLDLEKIEEILKNNEDITHIAMAHCEISSGILNSLEDISKLSKRYKKSFILDGTTTFGGMKYDLASYGIDFLISVPNECLEGVAGFSFVIVKEELLIKRKEKSLSYSLDLYDQWEYMEKTNGLWRFTPPTQIVNSFFEALKELNEEGGIEKRQKRYIENYKILKKGIKKLGFKFLVPEEAQSYFLISFIFKDDKNYNYEKLYKKLKEKGYIIDRENFLENHIVKIGLVGNIEPEEIENFLKTLEKII